MSKFKKNTMIIILWFIFSLIIAIVGTLLTMFNVVGTDRHDMLVFISCILSFIILGFLSGNMNQEKGLINGLIISLIVLIIFSLIFYLGFNSSFTLNIMIKYAILALTGGLGGIIGVNFKPVAK